MGKVYYDMGFLSTAEVIDCSTTDLVGQYIGHTGPKVQKLLEKALGKVLFIDEAYRLAEGHFATEAMDELVDCLTKPKYAKKLICILAGYDEDMNRLMSVNPGLTSRFPETVNFRPLTADESVTLLTDLLQARKAPLDVSVLKPSVGGFRQKVAKKFESLSVLKSWGNARDVQTIEKDIFKQVISTTTPPITQLVVTESIIISSIETMLTERTSRSEAAGTRRNTKQGFVPPAIPPPQSDSHNATNVQSSTDTNNATKSSSPKSPSPPPPPKSPKFDAGGQDANDEVHNHEFGDKRDAGVSDEIWNQLQQDKKAAEAREREYHRLEQDRIQNQQIMEQADLEAKRELERIRKAEKEARDDEERRRMEAERIRREMEARQRENMLARMEKERQKREQEKQKEMQAQKKLKQLGVCIMGFRWIKQAGGYRCAGGSHFVTDAQLGI